MNCKTKCIRLGICYLKLPIHKNRSVYYGNYNKPASSSSDFDEALAYALRCVQQESLVLNEHFLPSVVLEKNRPGNEARILCIIVHILDVLNTVNVNVNNRISVT